MPDSIQRWLVLVVVLLTVSATVVPPVGGTPTGDAPNSKQAAQSSPAEIDEPTALEQKRAAIATVDTLDVRWRSQGWHRKRAVDRLNRSLSRYRDENRVDSATVFREDRQAIQHLRSLRWTDATAVEEATGRIVSADLATVNASIDDARRALDVTEDRIENRGTLRRANRSIQRSIASRNRALEARRGDGRYGWRSSSNVRALAHLERAWRHAQRALDELERANRPTVTITTRSDPPRNGSEVLTRTIRGNVSAVRTYELGNVTVSVDGDEVTSVALNASTAPATNASFAVPLDLERPVTTVTVRVANGVDRDRRYLRGARRWGRWSPRFSAGWGADRDRSWRHWDRFDRRRPRTRSVTDTVRFDGDGLPDVYELDVVESDPLDPDSDATGTSADEAGDGVLDGGEDFDGDRLITYAEYDRETDPFVADTDADGLGDRFEASQLGLLDATDPDSNGDGILDGAEDFDGDGLAAADELANGTSVASGDTDHDGLGDAAEVRTHGTSPVTADTDGDGLRDGEEVHLGVDPLASDTDSDGVSDGNETFETSTIDDETGVTVSVVGEGDGASQVSVENVSQPPGSTFLRGPVVRIENRSAFERATVTIPMDGADTSNLSIYTWSPDDDRPWHPLNTTIDVENRTASANVASFSFFTVMDRFRWRSRITDVVDLGWPRHEDFADLSDWEGEGDVRLVDGSVVVSGRSDTAAGSPIVVAKDGSGDFERIQSAVDAASAGGTIVVRKGRYVEPVRIDKSVHLRGENATLEPSNDDDSPSAGLTLGAAASVSIQGFTILDYSVGVMAEGTTADVRLERIAIRRTGKGIAAGETSGDWTLSNVSVVETRSTGIEAERTDGSWTMRHVSVLSAGGNGMDSGGASGAWTLSHVEFVRNGGDGINGAGGLSDWSISDAVIGANGRIGVRSLASAANLTIEKSIIAGNDDAGIDVSDAGQAAVARNIWWGQPSGAAPGQAVGKVVTPSPCTTPACATFPITVAPPGSTVGGGTGETGGTGSPPGGSEGERATIRRTVSLPAGADGIELTARVRGQTSPDSTAALRVNGGTESEVVTADLSETFGIASADLARFAGETLTVEVVAEGDATISVDWIDVSVDTDGDGLRDVVEGAEIGLPFGPRPGVSLTSLDPSNPDSDGDGILDGDELTDVEFQPRLEGETSTGFLLPAAADADPTRTNSDGGGLTDAEEIEAGSDPFVLETLVVGYTIPTMTEGPGGTIADRNPMTAGEANGLQSSGGPDSDIIAWPSRQYFDPFFCIKELTGGPGCSPSWMRGVDLDDEKHYVYVPFVVYAESDSTLREIPYEMRFDSPRFGTVAKVVGGVGTVSSGRSQKGFVVYELPDESGSVELQRGAFRSVGEIELVVDLSNTIFQREETASVGRGFTVPTSTALPRLERVLEDTQFVLEQGINVAFAAQTGYSVAIETGSRTRGALAFLYHLGTSQISTPPKTIEDVAEKVGQRGIAAFEEKVGETRGEIEKDIFGDGVIRPTGPTIIRYN